MADVSRALVWRWGQPIAERPDDVPAAIHKLVESARKFVSRRSVRRSVPGRLRRRQPRASDAWARSATRAPSHARACARGCTGVWLQVLLVSEVCMHAPFPPPRA